MKEHTVLVQGNVHGREEEERVLAKQPTSIVLTVVSVSSPSAKIRYEKLTNECQFHQIISIFFIESC